MVQLSARGAAGFPGAAADDRSNSENPGKVAAAPAENGIGDQKRRNQAPEFPVAEPFKRLMTSGQPEELNRINTLEPAGYACIDRPFSLYLQARKYGCFPNAVDQTEFCVIIYC